MSEELRLSATVVDKFSQPLKDLQQRLRDIKTPNGLKETNKHFLNMHNTVRRLGDSIKSGLGAAMGAFGLSAVGVAAAVDGVAKSVRAFGATTTSFSAFNKATGISIQLLKELKAVAPEHGISSNAVEGDLRRMAMVRQQSRLVGYNQQARALRGGTALDQNIMGAKTDDDYLNRVLAAVAGQKTAEARNAVAQAYGVGNLAALGDHGLPVLNKQRSDVRSSLSEVSDEDIKKAEHYQAAMEKMHASLESLQEEVGADFAPVVTKAIDELRDLANAIRELVKNVEPSVKAFFDIIQKGLDHFKFPKWFSDIHTLQETLSEKYKDPPKKLNTPPDAPTKYGTMPKMFDPMAYHPNGKLDATSEHIRASLHRLVDLAGIDTIAAGVEKGMRALMGGDSGAAAGADGAPQLTNASYSPMSGASRSFGKHDFPSMSNIKPTIAHGTLAKNQQIAYNAAIANGLSSTAARAVVANLSGEGLAVPANVHWDRKHTARGIAQWDPSRSARIKQKFGHNPNNLSIADQIKAHLWEMKHFFPKDYSLLHSNSSASKMVSGLVRHVENPQFPGAEISKRMGIYNGLGRLQSASKAANKSAASDAVEGGKAHLDIHFHNPPKGLRSKVDGGSAFRSTHVERGSVMAPSTEI